MGTISQLEKQLLDKLLIEMLDLVEQSVQCKINIETTTNAGQLLLAKSRYIQGPQTVSQTQLPTEFSNDFSALKTVSRSENDNNTIESDAFELNVQKIDKETGFIDTIRWFGVLVPRCLYSAQERFNQAIEHVVECANIQMQLDKTIRFLLLIRAKME